jgi:flagellar biosynthetic protein FliQ
LFDVRGEANGPRARRFMDEAQLYSRKGVDTMDLDQATELLRHTLVLAMLLSAPMLVVGLVIGLIISVFQAVTQIQEQTLTFVPKIVAMIACAILLMPWMSQRLLEFSSALFSFGPLP